MLQHEPKQVIEMALAANRRLQARLADILEAVDKAIWRNAETQAKLMHNAEVWPRAGRYRGMRGTAAFSLVKPFSLRHAILIEAQQQPTLPCSLTGMVPCWVSALALGMALPGAVGEQQMHSMRPVVWRRDCQLGVGRGRHPRGRPQPLLGGGQEGARAQRRRAQNGACVPLLATHIQGHQLGSPGA